jgi:small nuclear ribonucleoprotein (snRNP)-like protein
MSEDWQNKILSKNSDASVAKQPAAEVRQTTSKSDKTVAIQSVTGGKESQFENINMGVTINLADRKFFFDIELRSKDGEKLPQNIELKSDSFYIARVSVSLNSFVNPSNNSDRYLLQQDGVCIDRQLNLMLESSILTMHGERRKLELNCRRDWYCDFLIQVSDRCESEFATLQLMYEEDGSQNVLRFASSLDVKVPISQRVSPPKNVKLTANIANANNAVILYVIPNGEKEWSIQGISPHEAIAQSVKSPCIPLDLWDYGKIQLGKVLKWVREAIAYFQNQCNLAIVDLTSQQIPWEMLELKPNEFLGVKSKVVRWMEQEAWGEPILLDLAIQRTYQGQIVKYEHPVNLSCEDLHAQLKPWRDQLGNHHRQPVAMGLLDCHEQLPIDVSFQDLARCLEECSENRPLFLFINSPCSALLAYQDQVPSGIAAKALSEVASGYLGTMAKVDRWIAKIMKTEFLKLAQNDHGVSPALFLQSFRAKYEKDLKSADDRKKREAEQIFSYVYYGNPNDVVKITGGEQL